MRLLVLWLWNVKFKWCTFVSLSISHNSFLFFFLSLSPSPSLSFFFCFFSSLRFSVSLIFFLFSLFLSPSKLRHFSLLPSPFPSFALYGFALPLSGNIDFFEPGHFPFFRLSAAHLQICPPTRARSCNFYRPPFDFHFLSWKAQIFVFSMKQFIFHSYSWKTHFLNNLRWISIWMKDN